MTTPALTEADDDDWFDEDDCRAATRSPPTSSATSATNPTKSPTEDSNTVPMLSELWTTLAGTDSSMCVGVRYL